MTTYSVGLTKGFHHRVGEDRIVSRLVLADHVRSVTIEPDARCAPTRRLGLRHVQKAPNEGAASDITESSRGDVEAEDRLAVDGEELVCGLAEGHRLHSVRYESERIEEETLGPPGIRIWGQRTQP